MCERLGTTSSQMGMTNVTVLNEDAAALPLADWSVDVVLSNYCFHHLRDAEKRTALREVRRVLRPGGRFVFGDMMFSLSLTDRRDRVVVLGVVRRMIAHGPAGVVRLLRNVAKLVSGHGEHPARVQW